MPTAVQGTSRLLDKSLQCMTAGLISWRYHLDQSDDSITADMSNDDAILLGNVLCHF
jgi:hypothetical protein